MSKPEPFIIVKADSRKQRQQFKNTCHQQQMPVCRAIPLLMQKVVDGDICFERQESIK